MVSGRVFEGVMFEDERRVGKLTSKIPVHRL